MPSSVSDFWPTTQINASMGAMLFAPPRLYMLKPSTSGQTTFPSMCQRIQVVGSAMDPLYGGLRIPTVRDNPLTQNPDSYVASGLFLSSKPAKTSGVSPKHSGICYLPIYLAFRLKPHHLLSCPDFAFFKSVTSNLRRCPAQWPRGVYSVSHNLAGFFFNITPLPVLKLRRF